MENRSNMMLVFGTVIVLALALAAYIMWATPSGRHGRQYDIVFDRSVSGLLVGSPITFAGVAVGRVKTIGFDASNPDVVRVRAVITDPKAPIVEGVTAGLSRDFFGGALITLEGAHAGARPILAARGAIPVIPIKAGAGFLGDPATIIENISNTSDRLNAMLDPAGQQTISERLADIERRSAALAADGALAAKIAATRQTMRTAAAETQAIGEMAGAMDRKLQTTGRDGARQKRRQLQSTRA